MRVVGDPRATRLGERADEVGVALSMCQEPGEWSRV
jgi:hypothetical protein